MTETDLVNLLIGFMNPNIDKKLKTPKIVNERVAEIIPKMSFENSIELLLKYSQLKKGSKVMVEETIKRVDTLV
jgi:hypothetical protein